MLNIDPLAPVFQILTCFNRGRKCKMDPHAKSCWGRTYVDTLQCKSNSVKRKSIKFLFVDVALCNPQLVEQTPCEFTVHISVELNIGQLMKGFRAYIINDSRFSPCHFWREWQTIPVFSALKKINNASFCQDGLWFVAIHIYNAKLFCTSSTFFFLLILHFYMTCFTVSAYCSCRKQQARHYYSLIFKSFWITFQNFESHLQIHSFACTLPVKVRKGFLKMQLKAPSTD